MNGGAIRVLLVDECQEDAGTLKEFLSQARPPFGVEVAHRLDACLDRLVRGGIDLILLALALPDSRGLDTLHKVRARAPHLPVIVLTALDDIGAGILAVREGAQEYLPKGGMDPGLLARAVRYAVERKRTEEALRAAHDERAHREKLAVLGQLAGSVTHELRNPLGAIKNTVHLLRTTLGGREPETRAYVEMLTKQVEACECIIDSLLGFARPNPPSRRIVSIRQVVEEALSSVSVPPGVTVDVRLDARVPSITADPGQLRLAFGNIILNAVQAMCEGGRLTVRSRALASHRVAVSFTDTGEGIPLERVAQVFEPAYTTKASGIGLGLTVTRSLVEGHGGTVEVKSTPGRGSTFTVRLPIGPLDRR